MIGKTLSRYRILEPLGSGGMGVVYRARDVRLERDVAVKVLPAGALADEAARKQFHKEALALARLSHPNIGAVYDFDSENSVDFLVMELVPGRTLSEILDGPLPERDVAHLGEQLADGLSAAHREGILHRDIKPANLRLTPENRLKILDFGLAKLIRNVGELSMTQTATVEQVAGTLPYMSPEQLRGGPLDARSDLYAAGAVLYELACGRRAFPQSTAPAILGAILGQPPTAPHEILPGIDRDLEGIILRCLEKDPADRYGSAVELAADLRELNRPGSWAGTAKGTRDLGKPRRKHPKRTLVVAAAVAVALVVVAGMAALLNVGGIRDRLAGNGASTNRSLAVLPLVNLSGDPKQEFFADGMTDELITRLAQVSAMRVISRSSVMQYKGENKSLRSIAKELGVGLVVEGSVARAGGIVRISAQLIDAFQDRNIWAESYERTASNVLLLESEVARAIVSNVQARLTPDERVRLASAPVVNSEAHEDYLRGLYYSDQFSIESFQKAIEYFNRSIEKDPSYAPAHAGLASAYCFLSSIQLPASEAMPRARAAAETALKMDPKLAAAYVPLAYVQAFYDWNWGDAERTFRQAIRLNPNEATAHLFYGQLLMITGRFGESSAQISRARNLDPLSSYAAAMSLWPLYLERRFSEAREAATSLEAADPKNASPHFVLGLAASMTGDPAHGTQEFSRAYELDPRPNYLAWVGWARARAGNRSGAREILRELHVLSKKSYVQPYNFAIVYAAVGEPDSAFAALERGIDLRSEEMNEIRSSVAMDPLRSDPRFKAILARMHLDTG